MCNLQVLFKGGEGGTHSIVLFSPQSTGKGNRDILEAVFAVKIEAGDGMSGHACRSYFSAAQPSSTSCKQ